MQAVKRVQTAVAVYCLGASAQRPSEMLSVDVQPEAGEDDVATGVRSPLPRCVVQKRSWSRLYDLFYLKGRVFKRRGGPVAGEWLVGSRPAGEQTLPMAVRAIETLDRMLAPIRSLAGNASSAALFLSWQSGRVPHAGTEIRRKSRLGLRKNLLQFYEQEIDWQGMPDFGRSGRDLRAYKATRGGRIRMIQWRKLYVEYMMRADARLRPALYRQLQHVSTATVGGDYLSSDPTIIEGARDASSAELARLLVGLVRGRQVAGRMAEVVTSQLAEVRRLTQGLEGEDAIAEVGDWLRERQLGIYALGSAKCLVALLPSQALCHIAAGTASFRQTAPNYRARTDERCDRCPCALVDDEHMPFWVHRYARTRGSIVRELARSVPADHAQVLAEFRAIAARADYARRMLEAFDHPVPADADLAA